MARQKFEKSFNTFVKGLMTEASEINFPENYSLYEKNFELRRDGGRDRRKGMDLLYPLGVMLTSRPYEVEDSEYIGVKSGLSRIDDRRVAWDTENSEITAISTGIGRLRLRSALFDMASGPEDITLGSGISRLVLKSVLRVY